MKLPRSLEDTLEVAYILMQITAAILGAIGAVIILLFIVGAVMTIVLHCVAYLLNAVGLFPVRW